MLLYSKKGTVGKQKFNQHSSAEKEELKSTVVLLLQRLESKNDQFHNLQVTKYSSPLIMKPHVFLSVDIFLLLCQRASAL